MVQRHKCGVLPVISSLLNYFSLLAIRIDQNRPGLTTLFIVLYIAHYLCVGVLHVCFSVCLFKFLPKVLRRILKSLENGNRHAKDTHIYPYLIERLYSIRALSFTSMSILSLDGPLNSGNYFYACYWSPVHKTEAFGMAI